MHAHAIVLGALAMVAYAAPAPAPEPVRTVTDLVEVNYTVWVDQFGKTVKVDTANVQAKTTHHDVKPSPAAATTTSTTVVVAASPAAAAAQAPAPAPAANNQAKQVDTASTNVNADQYPNSWNGALYAKIAVDHHNAHRANHSAPPVTWDATMAYYAYKTASTCKWGHDTSLGGNTQYGQNIQAGTPADQIGTVIDVAWYSEEKAFQPFYGSDASSITDNEAQFDTYGHFTQLVWTDTTKIGCASFDCSGNGASGNAPRGLAGVSKDVFPTFTVCNYYPPGNWPKQYGEKVKRPTGAAPISVDFVKA